MSQKTNGSMSSRRQFLRGAGGFALALPFLGSLVPREALAGTPPYAANPRFVAFATHHGGVWPQSMWPGLDTMPNQETLFAGHDMHWGGLQRTVQGSKASLSPVLTAHKDLLTESVASKMNVLRGLDVMFYIAHNTGGHLGNFARNDGNDETLPDLEWVPTIDQVMAWSPSFYPDLSSIKQRSMHIGFAGQWNGNGAFSWGHSSPSQKSGDIVYVPTSHSPQDLFNAIFVPDAPAAPAPRTPVVDRVIEHYRRLRDGVFGDASRISGADKQKLSDYMDRLDELERKLNVQAASCGDVNNPGNFIINDWGQYSSQPPMQAQHYQIYNDVIVAAFMCGTSRIAVVGCDDTFGDASFADWHQDVAHKAAGEPDKQKIIADAHQFFFENVYMDLVSKLDVEEADGKTLLDNTLVQWTQESGMATHHSFSVPVITAGSAAGFLETGQYIDYRDRDNMGLLPPWDVEFEVEKQQRPGLSYNQYLGTVLQAMGLKPDEYEKPGAPGYGDPLNTHPKAYGPHILETAGQVLPRLKA